ncbi:MAG: response regulator transcription factor [Clostridium perfringens]|nr:response regulator transcription factor [Clostridium perfringens]
MGYKILVVDDEKLIVKGIKFSLEQDGMEVTAAYDGEEALSLIKENEFDLVVLDVMLPKMDGLEVCQQTRGFSQIPIIMVTAKSEDMDKIMGLQFGADDYVLKPFNPLEITLRVKALIRRLEGISEENNSDCIEVDNFKLDLYSQSLYKENIEIDVTPKEFLLMKIFMQNPGKAFTRDELLNLVWGIDFFGDPKIVDVNIRRLRSKIEDNSSKPKYIETVWGTGYRWKR